MEKDGVPFVAACNGHLYKPGILVRARKRARKTGVYGRIHEDVSTQLTPPSRKRTVCRGALMGLLGEEESVMPGQGSGGNVLAALCSLFIPGLGQLLQGRLGRAAIQFVLAAALWFVLLGWIIHLWSVIDAAKFNPSA